MEIKKNTEINKRTFYTLVTSALISGIIVIGTVTQEVRQEKTLAKVPPPVETVESVPFIVREYDGDLGVFKGDSELPYKILDCNFSMLPDCDKEMFIEGVVLENEDELKKLIEDYTS